MAVEVKKSGELQKYEDTSMILLEGRDGLARSKITNEFQANLSLKS